MSYKEIIAQVASQTGLSKQFVSRTYQAYWRAVREHITSLPLKEDLTEEEFSKLRPNINIPSIGKLYVTYDRYRKVKKRHFIVEQQEKEKQCCTLQKLCPDSPQL